MIIVDLIAVQHMHWKVERTS